VIGLFVGLVVTAFLIWFLGAVLPGLEVEDFTSAALAALIVSAVGWLSGWFAMALALEHWMFVLYAFGVNIIGLILAGLMIAGLRVYGAISLFAAAAAMTAVGLSIGPLLAGFLMHLPIP